MESTTLGNSPFAPITNVRCRSSAMQKVQWQKLYCFLAQATTFFFVKVKHPPGSWQHTSARPDHGKVKPPFSFSTYSDSYYTWMDLIGEPNRTDLLVEFPIHKLFQSKAEPTHFFNRVIKQPQERLPPRFPVSRGSPNHEVIFPPWPGRPPHRQAGPSFPCGRCGKAFP